VLRSEWRYRLELVPVARRDSPADTPGRDHSPETEEWELVSIRMLEDGRTEQRMYRKPA